MTTSLVLVLGAATRGRVKKCMTTSTAELAVAAPRSFYKMIKTHDAKKSSRASLRDQVDGCRAVTRTVYAVGGACRNRLPVEQPGVGGVADNQHR